MRAEENSAEHAVDYHRGGRPKIRAAQCRRGQICAIETRPWPAPRRRADSSTAAARRERRAAAIVGHLDGRADGIETCQASSTSRAAPCDSCEIVPTHAQSWPSRPCEDRHAIAVAGVNANGLHIQTRSPRASQARERSEGRRCLVRSTRRTESIGQSRISARRCWPCRSGSTRTTGS